MRQSIYLSLWHECVVVLMRNAGTSMSLISYFGNK
jgi:hypothetical protein